MNQVPYASHDAVDAISEVAGDLLHPFAVRLAHDAGDIDSACRDIDDEEDVVADQPSEREHFHAEDVHRSDHAEMRLQKRPPRHPLASRWRGFESMLVQDPLDRVAANHVTDVSKGSTNPRVTPARVVGGKADDERLNGDRAGWTPRAAPSCAVVLLGDELAVPAQDRGRRHDAVDLREHPPPQYAALHREATALVVGESELSPSELLSEDPIFLLEVLDDGELATVDPAREEQQQELQRGGGHREHFTARRRLVGPRFGTASHRD